MTRDAIAEAVERYADMVYRVALQHLQNPADAEDITQEVFLRLLRAPDFSGGEEHEKAWLLRVTLNLCKDYHKSVWQSRVRPLEENDLPALPPETSEVLEALSALPEKHRTILHLYYIEGYSVAEIALFLGKNTGTVCSSLARARKQLKGLLDDETVPFGERS